MVRQEARDRSGLVVRHGEYVAEPTTAEDDLLARALGVVHGGARVDLSRANGGHEWARHWEVGAEARPAPAWLACGEGVRTRGSGRERWEMKRTVGVQANASAPCDAIISGAVEHRRAHHPELAVFGALALCIGGRHGSFVLAVRSRDDERRREDTA